MCRTQQANADNLTSDWEVSCESDPFANCLFKSWQATRLSVTASIHLRVSDGEKGRTRRDKETEREEADEKRDVRGSPVKSKWEIGVLWQLARFTFSFETNSDHRGSNFRNSSGEWLNEYWCFHHFGFNYMSHSAQSSFYSANLDWDPSRLSPIFHFPPLLLSSLHPISPFVEKKRKEKNLHVCDFLALQRMKPSFILIIAAQWIHAILATLFSISPNLHTA